MLHKHEVKKENLLDTESRDESLRDYLAACLKDFCPQALSEGRLNLEALSRLLGIESSQRGYELNFTGKPLATALYGRKSTKELKLETSFNPSNTPADSKDSTPTPSLRGASKASNEAIHNTESTKVDSSSLDSVDCHSPKGLRNDKGANASLRGASKASNEAIHNTESKLDCHALQGKARNDREADSTPHTIIKGDNLDALKLLKSAYTEKIKMIYIDPPYNTKNDNFIYPDDYREDFTQILREVGLLYTNDSGEEVESESLKFFRNITGSKSHSGWLAFMLPRLKLARDLLKDDGVIFISIDDNEQANLKLLCDEIFGEENFVACCPVVTNRGGRDYGGIAITHEYILIYQKDIKGNELNLLADENKKFTFCDEYGNFNLMELRNRNIKFNSENRPNLYYPFYVNPNRKDENDLYEISLTKHKDFIEVYPIQSQGINTVWRWGKEKAQKFLNTDIKAKKKKDGSFMIVQKYRSILKRQKSVFDSVEYITEKGSNAIKDILNAKVFDYPKSIFLIKDLLKIATTSPLQCGGGGATHRIA